MPRYAARRLRRAHCPGPSLHVALARPPADAARGGGPLDWRGHWRQHDDLQSRQPAAVCGAVSDQPRAPRAHLGWRRQQRLPSSVARARREPRARGPDGLQHRNHRELARAGSNAESRSRWLSKATSSTSSACRWRSGRGFTAREGAGGAATRPLSSSATGSGRGAWVADPAVIGSTLTFNARDYMVTGVIAEGARSIAGFGLAPEVYLPRRPHADARLRQRGQRRHSPARRPAA